MPSYIVTPISIKNIRSRIGKIGLIFERIPRNISISRKTYLITMISQASPTVINQWTLIGIAFHIFKESIIEPPSVIQFLYILIENPLLPIEPPKIHTLLFNRMQHDIEQRTHKLLIRALPRNIFMSRYIEIHTFRKIFVLAFKGSDTRCRMQIQGRFQMPRLGPVKKLIGIGKQTLLPCITGPMFTLSPFVRFGE